MKILHVIDSLNIGGAEVLVSGLSAASQALDDDVEIYALQAGGPLEAVAAEAGIPVHSAANGSVYSPVHILRLARFLRSRRFDVIHSHLYPAQLWAPLAALISRCATPIVTTEHSASNHRRSFFFFKWPDRWMYRRYTGIAAISDATRDALIAYAGKTLPEVRVIRNGIDTTRFEPRLREGHSPNAPLIILSVGRLAPLKDQQTIIRAVAMVDGVKLVLVGDGPQRREHEELAARLNAQSRVEFLGIRTDVPQLIANADIYVQASLHEGFCIAAAEAMCGGLPCIAARNSGLEEVMGDAGLFFEPGDAEGLAAAIRRLAEDPALRDELSRRGIAQTAKFTLAACHANYDTFYRDMMNRAQE
jgi:glycosyltransferase involved in cell wall biosynthesis